MFTSFPNVTDRFSADRCAQQVLFSEERHTLSLKTSCNSYITVYGELSIDHGRFEWAIRINKCGDKQGIIGVATGTALSCRHGKFSDELAGYGFCLNGLFRNDGQILNDGQIKLHEGDILFIRIDLNSKILSFAKNGILLDIHITNIPMSKYRLAISCFDENEQYTIVSPCEYLSKFSLYQYKLSILPLQDRFKFIGKPQHNYLKLLVHNTCVTATGLNNSNSNIAIADTAYGSRWISRGIFEWILQIQGDNADFIHFGVYGHEQKDTDTSMAGSSFENAKYGFGIDHNGLRLKQSIQTHNRRNSDYNLGILYHKNQSKYKYCSGFSLLDLVHIRLDLIQKTLSFTRNGNDLGIAFKNIYIEKNFGYRLAVKLKKSNCRISIVAAHSVTNQAQHERLLITNQIQIQIQTQTSQKQKTTRNLKTKSSGDIPKEKEKEKENIFEMLDKIKNDMNLSKKMIDAICSTFDDTITPKNGRKIRRCTTASDDYMLLLPQLFRSKRIGAELITVENEFLSTFRNWMNRVTACMIAHFGEWEEWNSNDITDWIISIENGIFTKYENKLRIEMKKAQLVGKHIKTLAQNISYVQRFGISTFEEQMVLQKYLNQLINGQYQENIIKNIKNIKNTQTTLPKAAYINTSKSYNGNISSHSSSLLSRSPSPNINTNTKKRLLYTQKTTATTNIEPAAGAALKGNLLNRISAKKFQSYPMIKSISPRIITNNNMSTTPVTPQEKIRQIEHEYHEQKLQNILTERAKLEKEKMELQKQQQLLNQQKQKQNDNNDNDTKLNE